MSEREKIEADPAPEPTDQPEETTMDENATWDVTSWDEGASDGRVRF